ncbi:MAG: PIN domain-containing protein [Tindallia sp. MSAO_Bac2]|nr:MAG: PIN domain-containing protein [Tindallia sp. MSAO_Bac2]
MKIYFDMNIYNRLFDDQEQLRIRFESMAIDILFELVEKGKYKLMWSFMLDYENSRNPYVERRLHIDSISSLCDNVIKPNDRIKELAKDVVKRTNAREKDALHLASAIFEGCNYFITCDDKFIKTIAKNEQNMNELLNGIILYNPIDFLRREMDIDVIE